MEVGLERTLRGHLHAETPPGSSGLAERDRGDQGFLPPQGPASPPPPDPEAGADRLTFTLPCLLCWLSTYRESGLRIHRIGYFSCWSLCQDGLRPPFLVGRSRLRPLYLSFLQCLCHGFPRGLVLSRPEGKKDRGKRAGGFPLEGAPWPCAKLHLAAAGTPRPPSRNTEKRERLSAKLTN